MRILGWFFCVALLLAAALPVALLAALQAEPLVSADQRLSQENVGRIKLVLRDANPRRLRVGDSRELTLVEEDFNLALNYGLAQFSRGAIQVRLEPARAQVALSLPTAPLLRGKYVNSTFEVIRDGDRFTPRKWRLGRLPVPDWLSRALARVGHDALLNWAPYKAALEALEEIELGSGQIRVSYHWRQELEDQLRVAGRQLLFDARDQQRLSFYHEKLYQLGSQGSRTGSLTPVLAALFDSAARNSPTAAAAVGENRALLLALAFHIARIDLNHFLSTPGRRLNYFWLLRPTLAQRYDLAQHFVISAGIAASAGTGVAAAAGLFKELKDSQGGSGFSFADLAADRAGTRLAELALDLRTARAVQETMRAAATEKVYMPGIKQLPEGIQELDFTARYDNLDNDAYRAVTREIDERIARCLLYASLQE